MIETEIIVEAEVESIKKKSSDIVNCTLQRKSICVKEKVIGIIHVQGNENKEHGSEILIIGHLKMKDLIEKNQENGPEKEEKEIGLENVGYLHHIILNASLFLFIMEPIMFGPLVPIQRHVPPLGGTRYMMSPLRPFPPRFIQPDIYRFCPFPNPRFRL